MKKQNSAALTRERENELFRKRIIEYIKQQDNSYEHTDFSGYSITKLVLLKVEIEIIKGGKP